MPQSSDPARARWRTRIVLVSDLLSCGLGGPVGLRVGRCHVEPCRRDRPGHAAQRREDVPRCRCFCLTPLSFVTRTLHACVAASAWT